MILLSCCENMNNLYAKDLDFKNNSNDCIIIFHGFASTPYDMKNLANSLSEKGYDVYVPLLPYHGINYENLTKLDLEEAFKWGQNIIVDKRNRYEKLFLIGVSIGSAIMYVSEITNPSADVLIGLSTGGVFSWVLKFFSLISRIIKVKYLPYTPNEDLEIKYLDEEYLTWKRKNFPKMPMDLFVQSVRISKTLNKEANKIRKPLLIINGSKDPVTSKKATSYYIKKAQNEKKLGIKIVGGKHQLLNTKYHDLVVKQILDFLYNIKFEIDPKDENFVKTIQLNS